MWCSTLAEALILVKSFRLGCGRLNGHLPQKVPTSQQNEWKARGFGKKIASWFFHYKLAGFYKTFCSGRLTRTDLFGNVFEEKCKSLCPPSSCGWQLAASALWPKKHLCWAWSIIFRMVSGHFNRADQIQWASGICSPGSLLSGSFPGASNDHFERRCSCWWNAVHTRNIKTRTRVVPYVIAR